MGRMLLLCVNIILAMKLDYTNGQECTYGSAKIASGPSDKEGTIEVCNTFGQWGQVCDDEWSQEDAIVACGSMGFSVLGDSFAYGGSNYATTSSPIMFSQFHCTGNESSLVKCTFTNMPSSDCNANTLAGIKCTTKGPCEMAGHTSCCMITAEDDCISEGCHCDHSCYSYADCCTDTALICSNEGCDPGSDRIAGGPSQGEGFIQVCNNGQWYHVCGDGWGQEEATVACKGLGFSALADSQTYGSYSYNSTGQPIGYLKMQCSGVEASLGGCSGSMSPSTCSTSNLATIKCTPKGSCEAAGHTSCCNSSDCSGSGGCQCDLACYSYGDCCFDDIQLVCPLDNDIECGTEMDSKFNILWPKTPAGITAIQSCSNTSNTTSTASRLCNVNGEWQQANFSSCQTQPFADLLQQTTEALGNVSALSPEELITVVTEVVPDILEELSVVTTPSEKEETSLLPNDLATTNSILQSVVNVLEPFSQLNESVPPETSENFVDVINNILEPRNEAGWQEVQTTNSHLGSELLLNNTENFAILLASSLGENETEVSFSRKNIVLKIKDIPLMEGEQLQQIIFPESKDLVNFTSTFTNSPAVITLPTSLLLDRSEGLSSLPVAHTIFNHLQDYLNSSANLGENDVPGTVVISSQVASRRDDMKLLQDPVTIDFVVLENVNFSSANCVFWDHSETIGNGRWSTAGIETMSNFNSNHIRCESSHLTSFAVLIDISKSLDDTSEEEKLALSIVTYAGCVVSIVCLTLTIIFFLTSGKKLLTNVLTFIHLNLALALLFAYIVFVAGIEAAVGHDAACTTVAVLLFYFFLASFCWMLCEGIMLYLMLVVVFSRLLKKWWLFLFIGWFPPVIPLAVSLGLEFDDFTEGLNHCWLSTSSNLIWAFVGPIIGIMAINAILLCLVLVTVVKNQKERNLQMKEAEQRNVVMTTLKATVVFLPLLGLTWLAGLFAVNENTTMFAWIFTVLNSLQGVAIFFFHVVRNEKVWNFLCRSFKKKKRVPSRTPFSMSSDKPGVHPVKRYAAQRADSTALTRLNSSEVIKSPPRETEKDKLEDNTLTEDNHPAADVTGIFQSETSHMEVQVNPEMTASENMLREQEESHSSSVSIDDQIPLV